MADFLSDSLGEALATWPQWESFPPDQDARSQAENRPRVIKLLQGGLTNQNYLLDVGGQLLVLRLACESDWLLGIDRGREQEILSGIAAEGFAPDVIYCRADAGILVTRFVEGQHRPGEALNDASTCQALLKILEGVHQCHRQIFCEFNYQAHLEHYYLSLKRTTLNDNTTGELYLQAGEALECLTNYYKNRPKVLCHHDPGPLNFIRAESGQWVLLDWEYAGLGWPVMDYVSLLRQWKPSQPVREEVLQSLNITDDEFGAAQRIWDFLDEAWYRLRGVSQE